jgi:aspartyl protease family protein
MPLDIGTPGPFLLALAAAFFVVLVASRFRIVRTLLSLTLWGVALLLVATTVMERSAFDPYLGRITKFLNLDEQQVTGGETRIRMAADGHFWVRVNLNGYTRRMLVDSGATITAISTDTAQRAGLEVRQGITPVLLQTANGAIRAETGTVEEMRLGNIVARDLAVVVSPAFGNTNVIGMNFLSRLASWRVEGRTLILVPHHPQEVDATS